MGPGGPGGPFMGRRERMMEAMKEPKPESIREVPGYLYRLITKFFYRLFYIFRLVWETKPWILFYMVFMAMLTLLGTLMADILYAVVDPRVRIS